MAADIGPLNIKAVVNAAGVDAGLDETKAKVAGGVTAMAREAKRFADAWSAGIAGGIKGGIAGLKDWGEAGFGLFQRAMEKPARAINELAVGGLAKLAGAAPLVGPLLALPFEGLQATIGGALDTFDKGAASIKEMGEAALKANMDIGQFQAIAKAAGDTEMAAKAMVKFREAMTNAALAGPGGRNAFTSLGLDPSAMMRDGDAFGTFAKAVRGVGDEFMQTHYAVQVFGKGAANLMPLLTTDRLDKVKGSIADFGAGFSAQDFAAIKEVEKASKQFKMFQEGFTNQVTIAVAPILAELAGKLPKLVELGVTFKGLGEGLLAFAKGASGFGAAVFEAFRNPMIRTELFDLFESLLRFVSLKLSEYLTLGVGNALKAIGKVNFGLGMGVDFGAVGDRMLKQAEVANYLAGRAQRDLSFNWRSLMGSVADTKGGGAVAGFFDDVQKRFSGAAQAAKDNNPFAVWAEAAREFQDSVKSPLDSFAEQIVKVRGLMGAGPKGPWIKGDALNTFFDDAGFLAAGRAVQQLRQAYGSGGGSMLSGALISGTAGAASAVNQARFSAQDTLADLLRTANQQREQLIKQGAEALNDPAMKVILKGRTP